MINILLILSCKVTDIFLPIYVEFEYGVRQLIEAIQEWGMSYYLLMSTRSLFFWLATFKIYFASLDCITRDGSILVILITIIMWERSEVVVYTSQAISLFHTFYWCSLILAHVRVKNGCLCACGTSVNSQPQFSMVY